ncbi:hypothetical protein EDD85DRAFT_958134 [Armillaria nabsnona]|nr:hypothetical protein EDD85DRAFT_958134 [Armillaria nabsnona]
MEKDYAEAVVKHAAWKEAKTAKAEEKRQEEEWLHLLKKQWEAEERHKKEMERLHLLKLKQEQEAMAKLKEQEEAMEKKKKDNLKKEKKKLRKEQKKKKEKAMKASKSNGVVAELQEERGMDVDTKGELLEASKAVALHIYCGGKEEEVYNEICKCGGEQRGRNIWPSSKRVRLEVMGPTEGEDELVGNKHCMRCHLDGAKCFTNPASKKSNQGWTCSHCKIKKAVCSFNKGTSSALAISSKEISEVLHNLVATMAVLAGKVNNLTGKVASLWSQVGDLCDDFCTKDIKSPSDILLDSEPVMNLDFCGNGNTQNSERA